MDTGSVRANQRDTGPVRPAAAGAGIAGLVAAAAEGDRRAVARLLSLAENNPAGWPELSAALTAHAVHSGPARPAQIVGLTGPPGVGKSTTTAALARAFRDAGRRVGVLAVDPSSPVTGGALLGDRIRMTELAGDPGVFVRSLASRGQLGGLALATAQALRVLGAAGYDLLLVETVGVGQAEADIAALADTTCLLLAPGAGDGVQAVKAGLLEVADILVVNKSDQPGADRTAADLTAMLRLGRRTPEADGPGPGVVRLAAVHGQGIDILLGRITDHYQWLVASGELGRRRLARARGEIRTLALATVRARLADPAMEAALTALAGAVVDATIDPARASERLLSAAWSPPADASTD
ncbi:methylmalonyl Co-A mutase-associated GTPase MeaB [Frankia sp. AgPm24]|uniref:methylmalonyl Co-A mutase-associated GTPase MeaB n=1 Tax=Frankia sp. AgPm24 TaxID=631128 RepID=UPI0035AF45CD